MSPAGINLLRYVGSNHDRGTDMFGMLGSLTKAAVGTVVETPISIVADVITLGGTLTDKDEPYTATSVKKVMDNLSDATESTKSDK